MVNRITRKTDRNKRKLKIANLNKISKSYRFILGSEELELTLMTPYHNDPKQNTIKAKIL